MQQNTFQSNDYEAVSVTDTGGRSENQDRTDMFSLNGVHVMTLADGMGGHPRGEVAAQIFVDCARLLLRKHTKNTFNAAHYITDVMQTAHKKIIRFGQQQTPPVQPRTTAVIVTVHADMMQWSHFGDSRIYLFRHGRAHVRTLDHTPVEFLRLKGEIPDSDSQSTAAGRSGITKCLGSKTPVTNVMVTPPLMLQDGDIILLCSDGIWSQLPQDELELIILKETDSLQQRTATLVAAAVNARQQKSDNATALAFRWQRQAKIALQVAPAESDSQQQQALESAVDQLQNLINRYS